MKVIPLAPQDTTFGLATHKVIIGFADLTTAGLTQTIRIMPSNASGTAGTGTCPIGTVIRFCGLKLTTQFAAPSITSLTVQVGDDPAGTTNRFLTATQILSGATPVSNKVSSAAGDSFAYDAATGVGALFTAITANLNTCTAGEVELYLHVSKLPNLSR